MWATLQEKGRIYEKPYSTSLFNFLSSMVVLIKFHVLKKMINNYAFQNPCEQEDHLNY